MHTWVLPFDALPINDTIGEIGEGRLIERYVFQKEFSLTSWQKDDNESEVPDVRILAVAPRFNAPLKKQLSRLTSRDTSLIDLPGSRKECLKISEFFPTKLIIGYDATEQMFDSLAPHFSVIHLSTHGVPSKENDKLQMLAFNANPSDTLQDCFLTLYEILNMKLSNNLVVLSACRSAIGISNKSEGSINLAWAFRQAGVKSILVSQWDVNDYASSEIMPAFYKSLSDGFGKAEALRQAKLDFIAGNDPLFHHPYYWAAFDYIGDNSQLCSGTSLFGNFRGVYFYAAMSIILLITFLIWRYRIKNL